jgi:putative transposase
MEIEVLELNVQEDHVHLVALVPPKVSISNYMGRMKGKTAMRMFSVFRDLRERRLHGNYFWAQGYCVGTVGLNEEKIRKYVKWQEKQDQKQEQFKFNR